MISRFDDDPVVQSIQASGRDTSLTWYTRRPTRQGFYWYRNRRMGLRDVVRVYRRSGTDVLRATGAFYEQRRVGSMEGEWAGPIPYPAE